MKKLSLLMLTSALVSLPALAHAEWYVGAGGGVEIPRDQNVKTPISKQGVDMDTGWGALGELGYKYGNGLRTELEFSFRDNGVDKVSAGAADGGSERIYTLMANALYDINTGTIFTPYLGVGAGIAKVSYDNVHYIAGNAMDDSDVGFAAQGIAGVSVPVADNLSFFTQYQYEYIFDLDSNTNSGLRAKEDIGNSLVTAGLRWEFGAPKAQPKPLMPIAAPAEPVRVPEPVQKEVVAAPAVEKYMVFFDFNRSDLTIEAADILKKVAENAKNGKVTKLEVTGHADRAGSDAYNMKLSARRAEAVKKQLIRLGMPAGEIATFAKGEREPLVPTADGVREPQNRRVEIVYGK